VGKEVQPNLMTPLVMVLSDIRLKALKRPNPGLKAMIIEDLFYSVSMCFLFYESIDFLKFYCVLYMLPQIVTRTAGSIDSRMGNIRNDVLTRCLAAIILTNFKCLELRNSNSC
jgi:hypothetical protein